MRRIFLKSGDVLFHKGDDAGDAYLILYGAIEISANDMKVTLLKSELFGESGLIGTPRMATATARGKCHLMVYSVDELRHAIQTEPKTAEMLIEVLIRRLAYTVDQLERLQSPAGVWLQQFEPNAKFEPDAKFDEWVKSIGILTDDAA